MSARMWLRLAPLLGSVILGAAARPAMAGVEIGAGMDYYTLHLQVNALDGRVARTLIQSTLAEAEAVYREGPMALVLRGAWSDWPVSGEWGGTGFETVSGTYFNEAWQQHVALECRVQAAASWEAGARISDIRLRHYFEEFTFLTYQEQAAELFLSYYIWNDASVQVSAGAVWAPMLRVDAGQDLFVFPDPEILSPYVATGLGMRWGGRLHLDYHDEQGWGLALSLQVDRGDLPAEEPIRDITITTGLISGYLFWSF